MSFPKRESYQQFMLRAFTDISKRDSDGVARVFQHYVSLLNGNFELAVNNVGDKLFGKVMSHEHSITPEQRKENPGVFEAISKARAEMNPQPVAACN